VTDMAPELSIVLPCYRSAALARETVLRLREWLPNISNSWEIIVVDDGGGDFGNDDWSDDEEVRLLRLAVNRGKGAAVRAGLLEARGLARIFTDVDLPFGITPLRPMVELLVRRHFHMVIGDRTLRASNYDLNVGLRRRVASLVFTKFVGTLVTGGFFDTQCGLKGLRGDIADALVPSLYIDRFAFDVELIYVALKHGLDIKRIPVSLERNTTSSVRLLPDSLRGVWDVLQIKARQLRGAYQVAALEAISRAEFEAMQHGIASRASTLNDAGP
jgi:dolichyl-phosphate beta-glucosyltransferase